MTLDRELIVSKIAKAMKFVPSKTLIPAFDNIKLDVSPGNMEITATDGKDQLKISCPVVTKDTFAICVPAKLFYKTLNGFHENEVTVTLKSEDKIEVKSGKSKYNIGLDCFPRDYPTMDRPFAKSEINMQQWYLKLGLKSAEKFVDEDSQNANFTAVNIAEIDNKMVFTGLVQEMMCRCAVPPISINSWETINVTPDTASRVISLLGDKGEVGITHSEKAIVFFTGADAEDSFEVTSTSAVVKFPNTESLFAKKPETAFLVNTMEFLGAMKRLKLYTETGKRAVTNVAMNAQEELRLVAGDNLTNKDGEELLTIINPDNYILNKNFANDSMIQILNSIEENEFYFHFSTEKHIPSFIVPKVNTEQEKIFSFLIASINH